jgi:hypothetical protein
VVSPPLAPNGEAPTPNTIRRRVSNCVDETVEVLEWQLDDRVDRRDAEHRGTRLYHGGSALDGRGNGESVRSHSFDVTTVAGLLECEFEVAPEPRNQPSLGLAGLQVHVTGQGDVQA